MQGVSKEERGKKKMSRGDSGKEAVTAWTVPCSLLLQSSPTTVQVVVNINS